MTVIKLLFNKNNIFVTFSSFILLFFSFGSFFISFQHDPYVTDIANRLLEPNETYIFGTDEVGFDVFSRTIVWDIFRSYKI